LKVAQADERAAASRRDAELQIIEFSSKVPRGVDPSVYAAALDAYRSGVQQALDRYLDQHVDILSTSFTEAQLTAMASFADSPAGQAWRDRGKELNIAMGGALAYVFEKTTAAARADYCKAHDCTLPPGPGQSSAASPAPSTRTP
ncbi:MAG: DUF2059 domain-containing protein, partial [Phenylobacterium sp.]